MPAPWADREGRGSRRADLTPGPKRASSKPILSRDRLSCEVRTPMIVDENASTESQPVLREQLSDALKEAGEAHDQRAVAIVRLIHTALKERDQMARAEGHSELTDQELIQMLQAMVEQRCESIRRYEENGQLELAGREAEEIAIIKRFLPAKLDE